MMIDDNDYNKCGIYMIINILNGKVYIGKSINIKIRMMQHRNNCRIRSVDENRHLINAWHKYHESSFVYTVLEYLKKDELLLKKRELYWMLKTNALNRQCGYNLRHDSDTKTIVSRETRELMSKNRKLYYKNHPERRIAVSKQSIAYFSNYANRKATSIAVTKTKQLKNKFAQYTRSGDFIKIWDTVDDIIIANPDYKWQNIYAVCNGYKPTYKNYKWRKFLKNEDIVHISMKIEN